MDITGEINPDILFMKQCSQQGTWQMDLTEFFEMNRKIGGLLVTLVTWMWVLKVNCAYCVFDLNPCFAGGFLFRYEVGLNRDSRKIVEDL